jgi:hypothetical protein
MALDPEGVVTLRAKNRELKASFGMRGIKEVERHFDKPFGAAVAAVFPMLSAEEAEDPGKVAEASLNVRFSDVSALFRFSLLRFHPEVEEIEADEIVDEIGVPRTMEVVIQSISAAMGAGGVKGGGGDAGAGPRKPPKRGSTSAS